jgi:hypothetical protein
MPRHDLSYESSSAEELVSNMRNLRPSAEVSDDDLVVYDSV